MKNIIYGVCLAIIAFTFSASAHKGRSVQEAVTARVVQDGVIINNKTGHTIVLRSITCDNRKDLPIHKMNKAFGKTHKQRLNTVSIQDSKTLSITPERYQVKNIHQCSSLKFSFGPAGSLTIKN